MQTERNRETGQGRIVNMRRKKDVRRTEDVRKRGKRRETEREGKMKRARELRGGARSGLVNTPGLLTAQPRGAARPHLACSGHTFMSQFIPGFYLDAGGIYSEIKLLECCFPLFTPA